MATAEPVQQINTLLQEAVSGPDEAKRRQSARQLVQASINLRDSVLPRGQLEEAASIGFPDRGDQQRLIAVLSDPFVLAHPELRADLITVLGEYGDEKAAVAIGSLLRSETDRTVFDASLEALKMIGGLTSAASLQWAVKHLEDENDRAYAKWCLDELSSGGTIDHSEGTRRRPLSEQSSHAEQEVDLSVDTIEVREGTRMILLVSLHRAVGFTHQLGQLTWSADVLSNEFRLELDPKQYCTKYVVYLNNFLNSMKSAQQGFWQLSETPAFSSRAPSEWLESLREAEKAIAQTWPVFSDLLMDLVAQTAGSQVAEEVYRTRFNSISTDLIPVSREFGTFYRRQMECVPNLVKIAAREHLSSGEIFAKVKLQMKDQISSRLATLTDHLAQSRAALSTIRDSKAKGDFVNRLKNHCQETFEITQYFTESQTPLNMIEPVHGAFGEVRQLFTDATDADLFSSDQSETINLYDEHVDFRQKKLIELKFKEAHFRQLVF